jgi:hypothetical protein
MITIRVDDRVASWSNKTEVWTSDDKDFAQELNLWLPDPDEVAVSDVYRKGGMEKIVLQPLKEVFKNDLKIISLVVPPIADELEEIVQ